MVSFENIFWALERSRGSTGVVREMGICEFKVLGGFSVAVEKGEEEGQERVEREEKRKK